MTRRLIRRLAALALLALPLAVAAAVPPPYTAEYEVRRNGDVVGRATVSFRALDGDRYELRTHTVGSRGLAAIAGVDVDERSLLRWTGGRPETVDYQYRQQMAWKTRERSLTVDAAAGRIDGLDKGKPYRLPYQAGVLDRHAVNVALRQDLAAGAEGELRYPVATRDEIELQRFRVERGQSVATANGPRPAIHVTRERDDDSRRRTELWFGTEDGMVPLRLLQTEGNGDSVEMRLLSRR